MLGFDLDFWDYVTFASLFIIAAACMAVLLFVGGLPGRIALSRKHPPKRFPRCNADQSDLLLLTALLHVAAGRI